ncbi:hypothetical protein P4V34_28855 [Bacillus thuringiensis]|nr:hypothetical protein [Bacillus thuringiensis]
MGKKIKKGLSIVVAIVGIFVLYNMIYNNDDINNNSKQVSSDNKKINDKKIKETSNVAEKKEEEKKSKKEEENKVTKTSLKEKDVDQGQLKDMKTSFDEYIASTDGIVQSIKPFQNDDWEHVQIVVNSDLKYENKSTKQKVADSVGLEVRNHINGYIGTGDPNFYPFITFSYPDGKTMAKSKIMDQSEYKVK